MKHIFTSISPNVEAEDRWRAWRLLLQPWNWRSGGAIGECEEWFKKYFDVSHAWSVNSGRSGLFLILKALGIGEGNEVLLQAFTCNAVPNPVLWVGATPVYVDIDEETLNIDPQNLEKKITPRAKAIIAQHTFGYPADMDAILAIAKKHNLIVIEDCAHALGAAYHGKKLGTLGDVAFFSFGRDKVVSSVYGGMLISKNLAIAKKIDMLYQALSFPSAFWIKQQLFHPLLMELMMSTYNASGRYLLVLLQKIHLLSLAVQPGEKRGLQPSFFPRRLPNALAVLAISQLQRLERFNAHRREIAALYRKELKASFIHLQSKNASGAIFLRYTVRHANAHTILKKAQKEAMYLGDWYTSVIAPSDTDLAAMRYMPGSCPHAEQLSREALNLPTHIRVTKDDAQRIADFLNSSL